MARNDKTGCILAFRNDRLGGRLNAILTAMRLARRYGVPFKIFWALSDASSPELHSPQDLFSKSFMDKHFTSREEGGDLLREASDIGTITSNTTEAEFIESLAAGKSYLSNAATEQLVLPWEDGSARDVLPELIESIGFSTRVGRMIKKINKNLDGLQFRSYHLRRGDIIDDRSLASHNLWSNKYIPRVIYEWHMKRELENSDDRLVIFSDSAEEIRAFTALSPRIWSFSDLIGDVELSPIQRDFLELYTMSRSAAIFAPPSSAFSGMAAVMANKAVTDIEEDLSAAQYDAAMAELVRRLEDEPDSFLSQSDIGQNLPFATAYLERLGEGKRATSIAWQHLRSGMDRAYIFSFLSERLFNEGRYQECEQIIGTLDGRPCFREEHWSNVFAFASMADMVRGNWDSAIERFHVGSWYFPINRNISEIYWYLLAMQRLPVERNWPIDTALMRRSARIINADNSASHRILVDKMQAEHAVSAQYPINMEVRDWRNLHGKKLSFRFSNKMKIEQQSQILVRNLPRASGEGLAALQSAIGALLNDAGKPQEALAYHHSALEAYPDKALYQKRYADYLLANGDADGGLQTLETAWEMSGRHPCYQADLALAHLKQKNNDSYQELMLGLQDSGSSIVELKFLVAEAMRRDNSNPEQLLRDVEELQAMLPGAHRVLILSAKVYEQCGKWEEAMAMLALLKATGRPEAVLQSKLDGLFKAYRRAYDAEAAKKWFVSHGHGDNWPL